MLQPLAIALVHYPVIDRRGTTVTAAVTNLDIHDLARLATSYGASRFYLVTPSFDQQQLTEKIIAHWREGFGATYNRDRSQAFELVRTVNSLDEALDDWQRLAGTAALPLFTGARQRNGIGYRSARRLAGQVPLLLVFGTGHGLSPELYRPGWPMLAPLREGGYNHLSVRTAAAIILDRLIGERESAGLLPNSEK